MMGAVNYPNNSVIQFDSIYHTRDHCHSLLCTTDLVPCCSASQGGNWHQVYMNGSIMTIVPTIPITKAERMMDHFALLAIDKLSPCNPRI